LKQHKPWFDEECLGSLDYRKTKMQWLQDPNSSIVDSLNKVRRDGSRHCRNTKKERLKTNIDELETNSKIKKKIRDLYRGISDFRTNYQPRTDILKD